MGDEMGELGMGGEEWGIDDERHMVETEFVVFAKT